MSVLQLPAYSAPVSSLIPTRRLAIFLLVGDLLGIISSLKIVHFVRLGQPLNVFSLELSSTVIFVLLGFYIADAYRPNLQVRGLWAPARTLIGCLLVGVALATFCYLFRATTLTPLLWRSVLLPALGLFTLWAVLLRLLASAWVRSHAKQSSCLLLGADASALQFKQDFMAWNPLGKLVVLTDTPHSQNVLNRAKNAIGSLSDLSVWSSHNWSGVVVTPHLQLSKQDVQQLMQLRLRGTPVYRLPDFYEMLWQKLPPILLQDTWFAFEEGFLLVADRISLKIKRLFDLLAATLLLVVLSPIMLLAALAIKLESPGPIFYTQLRNGLNSKPFRVCKFRSMRQNAEQQGAQWAQKRDPRVTQVGYWLRLMRIDELPQLWNVLRGEMSLIGPRPERPEFDNKLAAQIPYYNLRYLVKPGITGWAQVMYPYGASVEDAYEKLSYDLYYIKNYSILLDLVIAFKTVRIVFLGKGR